MELNKKEEPTPINRLILVGNGFDLAHRMKTKYSDFILWYFQKCWENAIQTHVRNTKFPEENIYSNELITISYHSYTVHYSNPLQKWEIGDIEILKSLLVPNSGSTQRKVINLTINSPFLKSIVDDVCNKNWVDIENIYYQELRRHYREYTLRDSAPISSLEVNVKDINDQFDVIKRELEIYLQTITVTSENEMTLHYMYELPYQSHNKQNEKLELQDVLLLNFNYTATTQNYKIRNATVIHIHGELNMPKNPIIFGFGDERDETYALLEKANIPEVFTHIKSFDYFKTDNYSRLLAFLESDFDVYIMGHSCGLSDRTLLSTIFEHDNCRFIKIFYHDNAEHYRKTTYEISRHFTDKALMRKRVLPITRCEPMPQSR